MYNVDEILNEAIRHKTDVMKRDLVTIRERRELLTTAVAAVNQCPQIVDDDFGDYFHISGYSAWIDITVHEVHDLCEIAPLIEALKQQGLLFTKKDDSNRNLVSYHFHPPDSIYRTVVVYATLDSEGSCRRIPTGEMKPVMKTVCPGDPDYPEDEDDG